MSTTDKSRELCAKFSSLEPALAEEVLFELRAEALGDIASPFKTGLSEMQASSAIDSLYDEMRAQVKAHAGRPGLREALLPIREKLRILEQNEALDLAERYDSRFRTFDEKAEQLMLQARHLLGVE
jgi:hypothetical protein